MALHDLHVFRFPGKKIQKTPSQLNLIRTRIHYDFHMMYSYFFQLYAGILTPSDEFQYWADLSESAEKNSVRERATHITEQFKLIQKVCMQTFIYQQWLHEKKKIQVITFTTDCFYMYTGCLLTELQLL